MEAQDITSFPFSWLFGPGISIALALCGYGSKESAKPNELERQA